LALEAHYKDERSADSIDIMRTFDENKKKHEDIDLEEGLDFFGVEADFLCQHWNILTF